MDNILKMEDVMNTSVSNLNSDLETILNNELVKFENKQQSSMYFVTSKAIMQFCKEFTEKNKIDIPNMVIQTFITKNVPELINNYAFNLKKRHKKTVNTELLCLGRKMDNSQCTRKKYPGFDYCKSHVNKITNSVNKVKNNTSESATVSGNKNNIKTSNINNENKLKKRGRKRKVVFDPRQYDNEYITLWEDIVDGKKVLIDINNNVYTFDLVSPKFLGRKTIDMKINEADLIPTTVSIPEIIPQKIPQNTIPNENNIIQDSTITSISSNDIPIVNNISLEQNNNHNNDNHTTEIIESEDIKINNTEKIDNTEKKLKIEKTNKIINKKGKIEKNKPKKQLNITVKPKNNANTIDRFLTPCTD